MKRLASFILALSLLCSLAVPALAEGDIDTGMLVPGEDETIVIPVPDETAAPETEGMDAALQALTLQVKEILGVDDSYTSFTSQYSDDLVPKWNLYWSDDTRNLSVDVTADGKIVSVSRWEEGSGRQDYFYGFDAAFPALSQEEADEQAQMWYGKLFTGSESARTDFTRVSLGNPGSRRYYGVVDVNGLPSPITFSFSLTEKGIDNFYRSDAYMGYVGIIPDSQPGIEQEAAAQTLAGTAEMELYYVTGEDGRAELRYVPVSPRTVVNAQTGEAVDMDALYESIDASGAGNGYGMTEDSVASGEMEGAGRVPALTEVELTSIAGYGEVMDGPAIDEALRKIPGMGLENFTQERCSYYMDEESGEIVATVRYTAVMTGDALYGYSQGEFDQAVQSGQDMTIRKTISLDAKSGEVKSISTSYPLWEKDESVTMEEEARQAAAEAFLAAAVPERREQSGLCTLRACQGEEEIVFAQVHDGYFYPDNCLKVLVNPAAGTVDSFQVSWEDVEFGPSEGVVDEAQALAAYTQALQPVLGYVAWPLDLALDENQLYSAYAMWGYSYVEELRLAYYYDNLQQVLGVDAMTGEAVTEEEAEGVYSYDDLRSVPQAEFIAALGQSGIGFEGGQFRPEEELTTRDALILLLRAAGSAFSEDDDETILEEGYYQGFLEEKSWEPEKVVTGDSFLSMLVGASRYGDGAELLQSQGQEGYRLMAEALGLEVAEPDQTLTRAGAAELLYTFLSRNDTGAAEEP